MSSGHLIMVSRSILLIGAAVALMSFSATLDATAGDAGTPWDLIPERPGTPDHSAMLTDPFTDAHEVTSTCLICHVDVGAAFMKTSHWTWISDAITPEGTETGTPFGKINSINNFCIAVDSNWARCSQCHAGYGWRDASFDFTDPQNIDCLVCHDTTGTYRKSQTDAGYPEAAVDLLAVAQSVGRPSRANCGACHFYGGGGDGVKHGDMDTSLTDPPETIDVHMGRHDLLCQDCHTTHDHQILGRLAMINSNTELDVRCETCHGGTPHSVRRLNAHSLTVACQTCHIPSFAVEVPTRLYWDWSAAGLDEAPDERDWDKKKGSFVAGTDVVPDYLWWNGAMQDYLPGQQMDPTASTDLNRPLGDIADATARIWPFKVHRGKQPYDVGKEHFLVPKLAGEDGFWTSWDWNAAFELGAEASGVTYSGEFDFAETAMYWPVNHMVRPKEHALGCMDCHGAAGRMPWVELGYASDPMISGGRG